LSISILISAFDQRRKFFAADEGRDVSAEMLTTLFGGATLQAFGLAMLDPALEIFGHGDAGAGRRVRTL
jgi:hypothetical protein